MPDPLDGDVPTRFVNGDRDAFEALFRQHRQEVYQWAFRIVRDRSAAEDVLIESFWRAYRGRARFDPSRSFGAWMRRITTHVAIDHLNAARRRQWIPLSDRPTAAAGPAATEEIVRAFHALPPRLRVVATLALIEEEPLAAIADALDLPIGTVKSRLFRATRQLRQELARLGVQP